MEWPRFWINASKGDPKGSRFALCYRLGGLLSRMSTNVARKLPLEFAGAVFHVNNRGNYRGVGRLISTARIGAVSDCFVPAQNGKGYNSTPFTRSNPRSRSPCVAHTSAGCP